MTVPYSLNICNGRLKIASGSIYTISITYKKLIQ